MNWSSPMTMPTCEGPREVVLKNTRSPERQVARLHLLALVELLLDGARQRDAVAREHVLREAAAVEPARVRPAVPVGHAAKGERRADDGVGPAAVCGRDGPGGRGKRTGYRASGRTRACAGEHGQRCQHGQHTHGPARTAGEARHSPYNIGRSGRPPQCR